MDNPFVFRGYSGLEYFCDRQKELLTLMQCVRANVNVTLVAQRRMGKTGLIYRFIDELRQSETDVTTIYVDIFATRDVADMNKAIADAILSAYPEKTSFGQRFMKFVRGLRPLLAFDPLSGAPQVQMSYQTEGEKIDTLESMLQFLEQQPSPVLLAIDEFQQIREYPEQNVEARLRTVMQQMHNVTCIFCGSRKHMMVDIFSNPQRPFYASTQFLGLDYIDSEVYADFIVQHFQSAGRTIDTDAVAMILSWTRRHTYFTQRLCHAAFAHGAQHTTLEDVKQCCIDMLNGGEPYFLQYRSLLSDAQWNFLVALAKEGEVEQPYATRFLKAHNIGAAAVARRNLQALLEKDLVFCETTKDRTYYAIADVFLMRWLAREY